MVDPNLVLALVSIVAVSSSIYIFRSYLNQEFYRWMIISSISIGLWSLLIIMLDYIPTDFLSGIVLSLFIATPITSCICYFIMSYEYATRNKIPRAMYILFLIPLSLFVLGLLNPDQMVFSFESVFTTEINSSLVPGEPTTIRFLINVGLGYAIAFMSVGIIISEIIDTDDYNKIYQGVIILGSILLICVLSAFRLASIMPYGIDLSVVAINTVLLLFVLPKTKEKMEKIEIEDSGSRVEGINHPVLVSDSEDNIIDLNEEAEKILKNSDTRPKDLVDENEFSSTINGSERHYKVNSVSISESPSEGTMHVISDISKIKGKVKDLEVAQQISSRILRHNVKNKLTPIMGYADMIDSEEYSDKISESAESLAETSNKALELNRCIANPSSVVSSDLSKTVRNVVNQSKNDVSVCCKGSDFKATVPENMDMIVKECIDNSVQHNSKTDIDMRFDLKEEDSNVVITYTDDGSGVPRDEIEVLERMEETDLKHSTGCGVWMMKWMIESAGGEFDIWNDDGAVVQMRLEKSNS